MSEALDAARQELEKGHERKARGILWRAVASLSDTELDEAVALVQPLKGSDAAALLDETRREKRRRMSVEEREDLQRQREEMVTALRSRLVTTESIPGVRVIESLGLISAVAVMDRNVFSDLGSDLKAIGGGELVGQTKELKRLFDAVLNRLVESALSINADGVVGVRLVSPDTGRGSELVAYGTAVRVAENAG